MRVIQADIDCSEDFFSLLSVKRAYEEVDVEALGEFEPVTGRSDDEFFSVVFTLRIFNPHLPDQFSVPVVPTDHETCVTFLDHMTCTFWLVYTSDFNDLAATRRFSGRQSFSRYGIQCFFITKYICSQ